MTSEGAAVRAFFLGAFVQAVRCHDETGGEAFGPAFVRRMGKRVDPTAAPSPVEAAYRYYHERVEQQDWGGVGVFMVSSGETMTYAVHTTCDGDEQWLELYDGDGGELGFARIYVDTFDYVDRLTLRATRIEP